MKEVAKRGSGKKIAAGIFAGAIAGAIAGILFTPKKGKEIRADLKKHADKIKKEVAKKAEKMEDITKEKYNQAIKEVSVLYKKAKKIKEEDLKEIVDDLKDRWPEVSKKVKKTENSKNKEGK